MILYFVAVFTGLIVLLWSADQFVGGAAKLARHLGMTPLLIGMLIVGFGTSAPEMVVSALASIQGNPGLALGNAYGSNIANIGLILGITALISPIAVHSAILKKELPFLSGITTLVIFLLLDKNLNRYDAWIFLVIFFGFMGWSVWVGRNSPEDSLADEVSASEFNGEKNQSIKRNIFDIFLGLLLLISSSKILVWGAVEIARKAGVSDLMIGLTVVAIGTSLPELASSVAAIRRKETDIAVGNVIGSNLFNTLVVVGIAGSIMPFRVPDEVLSRDMLTMGILTISLFIFGYGFKGVGRINRIEGAILLAAYLSYTGLVIAQAINQQAPPAPN